MQGSLLVDWKRYTTDESMVAAARRREEILLETILPMREGSEKQGAMEGWKASSRSIGTTLPALRALVGYEADHGL